MVIILLAFSTICYKSCCLLGFMTTGPADWEVVGSPFRRCEVFLWYGCWCLWRARSRAWLFDLWWSSVSAGWVSLQLDLSGQMKRQDTQRSHTPTLIFSHHEQKFYCSVTSTFITSVDSPSPAVILQHRSCTKEQIVNHMCCLSCWDKGICKSPSSFSLYHPPLLVCLSLEQGRSSLRGRNNHQKTSLRPHAERLVRGRGLGVLSCPITSVPFILHGMGGEGGWRGGRMEMREAETGVESRRWLFSTVRYVSLLKETE